mmetsp:Transcript_12186/g.30779  ORF Transcript_12186/g.30779 Transcript_12186/m.30779 type:complete len:88 (+) Transcript_12186:487-750(+)
MVFGWREERELLAAEVGEVGRDVRKEELAVRMEMTIGSWNSQKVSTGRIWLSRDVVVVDARSFGSFGDLINNVGSGRHGHDDEWAGD